MPPKSHNRNPRKRDRDATPSASKSASPPAKKPKSIVSKPKSVEPNGNVPGGGSLDDQGNSFWVMSDKKRLVIHDFHGLVVSVREFYDKDGKTLPGAKGVTLPIEQFATLVKLLPHVEAVLKEKYKQKLPRPVYETLEWKEEPEKETEVEADAKAVVGSGPEEGDEINWDEELEGKKPEKKNYEQTSDEG